MEPLRRKIQNLPTRTDRSESLLALEWLVTNGLGGYAAGTITGACTRRYHGLLIAALPNPLGRRMMLNHLTEQLQLADGRLFEFGAEERSGRSMEAHTRHLTEFQLERGLPVWRYSFGSTVLEKRVFLPHGRNTVCISYRLIRAEGRVRLGLRPSAHFRAAGEPLSRLKVDAYGWKAVDAGYELWPDEAVPPLRLRLVGAPAAFHARPLKVPDILYPVEERRGYEAWAGLWSPGEFWIDLLDDRTATLIASAESWETIVAQHPEEELLQEHQRRQRLLAAADLRAQTGFAAELVLAADQFVIVPAARPDEWERRGAWLKGGCTVVAGYHWFTDWGRDTMIGMEGILLATGRHAEASDCLRMFARHVRDGLIPNTFPEGQSEGVYDTADATLWFFHALDRYLKITGDRELLRFLLPTLIEIVEHHIEGTGFGIRIDSKDGLLRQGAEGCALTWMDARVDRSVITPRRGKAVEINALWYNALRLLEGWLRAERSADAGAVWSDHAARAYASFNERFWYEEGNYLYDVIDGDHGDDAACRPNQILAISLPNPILDRARWDPVVAAVREQLLTPLGLRTLAPCHSDYKAEYFGDPRSRDAAYHQGTVWPWLIGPFIDAWLKLHPDDRTGARRFLEEFVPHLSEACIGSISEIADAEEPFTPRGCVAQAWSVAEVLRGWINTAP